MNNMEARTYLLKSDLSSNLDSATYNTILNSFNSHFNF